MKNLYLLTVLLIGYFSAFSQSLTGISPQSGSPKQTINVTISGQNTNFTQATYTDVMFRESDTYQDVYANNIVVIDDNTLDAYVYFDANYGTSKYYDLYVFTNSYTLTIYHCFELLPLPDPQITAVNPSFADKFESLTVTISGQNLDFEQATNTVVWFSQGTSTIINPDFYEVGDTTTCYADFSFPYTSPLGYYDVNTYVEGYGLVQKQNGFYLNQPANEPEIVGVQPDSITTNDTVTIRIFGSNTHFTSQDDIDIWFESGQKTIVPAETVTVINDEEIVAFFRFPDTAAYQKYDLHIFGDFDGGLVLFNAFHVGQTNFNELNSKISVSPNPVNALVRVKAPEIIKSIELIDINGRILEKYDVNSYQKIIDLRELSHGIYYLKIIQNGQIYTKKILKN